VDMNARDPLHRQAFLDEVCDSVPWDQFQRFRRGVVWTPQRFRLMEVSWRSPCNLDFRMAGDTDIYRLTMEYLPNSTEGPRPKISCSCPDAYPGLCKHICWLVFKVLGCDALDVFRTHRLPVVLISDLIGSQEARQSMVARWGGPTGGFQAITDRELSFASWTPPKQSPFGDPASWPPPNSDCTICFEDMERAHAKQCPACANCFHDACIATWFSHKTSCPLCRKQFVNA